MVVKTWEKLEKKGGFTTMIRGQYNGITILFGQKFSLEFEKQYYELQWERSLNLYTFGG